jgi:hypothetical protein
MSSASKFASGITIYFSTFFLMALPSLPLRFFLKGESPSMEEKAYRAYDAFLGVDFVVLFLRAARGPVAFLTILLGLELVPSGLGA